MSKMEKYIKEKIENYLEELMELLNREKIDHNAISYVASIDLMKKYPHIKWNEKCYSESPNISVDDILKNDQMNWCYKKIVTRRDVTLDKLEKIKQKTRVNLFFLSYNPNLTWDYIKNIKVSEHDAFWCEYTLACNPAITMDVIKNNPNPRCTRGMKWKTSMVSRNPNLTIEYLDENLKTRWNWYHLTVHPNITWDMIKERWDKEGYSWVYAALESNPNINIELMEKEIIPFLKSKNIHIENLYTDPDLVSDDTIDRVPEICRDYHYYSYSPGITLEYALAHDDKPWAWEGFFDLKKMRSYRKKLIKKTEKEYEAVKVIEKAWLDCRYIPLYRMCRKLVIKDYYELYPE